MNNICKNMKNAKKPSRIPNYRTNVSNQIIHIAHVPTYISPNVSLVIAVTDSHVVGTADVGITWSTTKDRTHLIRTQRVTDKCFSETGETLQSLFIDLRVASNSRFRNITRDSIARVTSELQKS